MDIVDRANGTGRREHVTCIYYKQTILLCIILSGVSWRLYVRARLYVRTLSIINDDFHRIRIAFEIFKN